MKSIWIDSAYKDIVSVSVIDLQIADTKKEIPRLQYYSQSHENDYKLYFIDIVIKDYKIKLKKGGE